MIAAIIIRHGVSCLDDVRRVLASWILNTMVTENFLVYATVPSYSIDWIDRKERLDIWTLWRSMWLHCKRPLQLYSIIGQCCHISHYIQMKPYFSLFYIACWSFSLTMFPILIILNLCTSESRSPSVNMLVFQIDAIWQPLDFVPIVYSKMG